MTDGIRGLRAACLDLSRRAGWTKFTKGYLLIYIELSCFRAVRLVPFRRIVDNRCDPEGWVRKGGQKRGWEPKIFGSRPLF